MTVQLYKHYNVKGVLLYVGVSRHAGHRFSEHKINSIWAALSVRMVVEMYPDRLSASIAELEAVQKEKPLYNKHHLERKRAIKAPQVLERPRRDEETSMVSARISVSVIEKMNTMCLRTELSRSQLIETALKKFMRVKGKTQ